MRMEELWNVWQYGFVGKRVPHSQDVLSNMFCSNLGFLLDCTLPTDCKFLFFCLMVIIISIICEGVRDFILCVIFYSSSTHPLRLFEVGAKKMWNMCVNMPYMVKNMRYWILDIPFSMWNIWDFIICFPLENGYPFDTRLQPANQW